MTTLRRFWRAIRSCAPRRLDGPAMADHRQLIAAAIVIISLIAALGAAVLSRHIFVEQVQAAGCFEYARRQAVPNVADLDLVEVVIATGRHRDHICRFTDRRTGRPVSLAFDAADVPYVADTLQVCCMVVPFLGVIITGAAAASADGCSNKPDKKDEVK